MTTNQLKCPILLYVSFIGKVGRLLICHKADSIKHKAIYTVFLSCWRLGKEKYHDKFTTLICISSVTVVFSDDILKTLSKPLIICLTL